MRIETLPASEVPGLRSGYAFTIYNDGDIVCDGRIKPSGRVIFAEGSAPPPRGEVSASLNFMAKRYAKDGIAPAPITTFEAEEDAPPGVDEGA